MCPMDPNAPDAMTGLGGTGGGRKVRSGFRAGLIVGLSLLALLVAGVAALAALLAAGNPALSRRVVAALNDAVGTDSTRFACDRVSATIFQGAAIDHPRLLVQTPDGEVTWAEARRLRVDYDLLGLLFGRHRDLRVVVESPLLTLTHDRRGEVVVPRFRPGKSSGSSRSETRIEVTIQSGGFSLDREEIRFGGIGGSAQLILSPPRASVLIRNLAGSSQTPGRPGRLDVSGMVVVEGGTLRADPFEVALGSSRISARVDWSLAEARVLEGELELHPLHLQEFFRVVDLESAPGTLSGSIGFAGTPSEGEARACLEGSYAGEPIDTLLFHARSRPGAVEIADFKLRIREAELSGRGTVSTAGTLAANLAFRDVNPAVLPWWRSPEQTPPGSLSGRARLDARRAKPRPELTVAVSLEPSRIGRIPIERGFFRARSGRDGGSSVDSAWIEIPGGRLEATGAIGSDRSVRADVSGLVSDLSKINSYLHPMDAASGRGRVVGSLTGSLDHPRFRAQADLYAARFTNGISCDTLTVEVQGGFKPEFDLTADIGARGLGASGRSLGHAEVILAGGRTLRIERYHQSLGDTVLALQGAITFAEDGAHARLDSLSLTAGEHRVRNREPVELDILREHFRTSNLALDLNPGSIEASVDWNPGKGTIDARGMISGLMLENLREIQPRGFPITGKLGGEFLATGSIADPDLAIHLSVVNPGLGPVQGDSLAFDLAYAPGLLSVDRAAWSAGESRLLLTGSVRPRFTLEDWLRQLTRKDRAWATRTELALQVSADSLDLALVAPVDSTLRSLQGWATLKARVSGTPAAPVIAFEGRAPRVSYREVDGELLGAELTYQDQNLQIDRFDVRQGTSVSQIRGSLPIDLSLFAESRVLDQGPLSLSIQVPDANLALFPILFPDIASSAGRFTLAAEVRGTPRNPNVTGAVRISDGKLRLAGRDEVLYGVTLDAIFDHERVTVTQAKAKEGKRGLLAASGYWRWPASPAPPGEPPAVGPRGDYSFQVKATDFTVSDRETYLFRFTGNFVIVNGISPSGAPVPSITGSVRVSKGELTMDLSKPAADPSPPLPVRYNVTAEIPGNLFYRTLDAEVELEAEDLVFKNEGRGDLALGILNVKGGKYYILTREFRDLRGTINCNNPDRIDPEVAITAETTLPGGTDNHKVYLSLSDRISKLKVRVYDDEGTSSNDLWKALAFGQFTSLGGTDVAQGGGTEAQDNSGSVAVPITNYLFQNVERWIGSAGFIDTIDLRSSAGTAGADASEVGPISAVGVGKYVTPEIYLKYTRAFSAEAEEEINADYRITRSLFLKGQQIRRPTGQDRPQQEYNVDLKVRLEY